MSKLRLSIAILIFAAATLCGCTADNLDTISDGIYIMKDCDEAFVPYVMLEGKSNEGNFTFVYSGVSSYVAFGKYHTSNSELVLNDDSGNTYTFTVDGTNLIFDADKSSEIPEYEGFVTTVDGSIFSLTENK